MVMLIKIISFLCIEGNLAVLEEQTPPFFYTVYFGQSDDRLGRVKAGIIYSHS